MGWSMSNPKPEQSALFNSEDLATHLVDTLVDHGFIERARLNEAISSAKWELDAQSAMGRVILKADPQ
jgi:hypothetical protein